MKETGQSRGLADSKAHVMQIQNCNVENWMTRLLFVLVKQSKLTCTMPWPIKSHFIEGWRLSSTMYIFQYFAIYDLKARH